jgi:hypothetical protein
MPPDAVGQLWDTQRQKTLVFHNTSQQSQIVKSLILLLIGVVTCWNRMIQGHVGFMLGGVQISPSAFCFDIALKNK